ncbi:MAG: molybdenum cofactor guanylyltransferase [Chloroflexi bacterium]|nr:molybdenum cofactor guanylyltransferase [Chloroflexota bacterium]
MHPAARVPTIVLAGGASTRMGTDKRLVLVDGAPMLHRTLDRVAPAPCMVVIDPRDPPSMALPSHAHVVVDTRPGEGPLAALEAGLRATDASLVVVVGGDMPWVDPAVLALLTTRLTAHVAADVACLADANGPRPLPLALRRSAVLTRLTALLDHGERRLRVLLANAVVVGPAAWQAVDPRGDTLRDVDTPADLVTGS